MDAYNPFSDPSVTSLSASNEQYNPFDQNQATSYSDYEPLGENKKKERNENSKSYDTEASLLIREQNILKKEAELEEKERRLNSLENQLITTEAQKNNWPCSFWAFTFHNIEGEIPVNLRSLVWKFYVLVILTWVCFLLNWFSILSTWFSGVPNGDVDALWATVYFFTGCLGSWKLWYRSLYFGCKEGTTRKWLSFFFWIFAHFAFVAVMIVGVKGFGGAGVIMFINNFTLEYKFAGVVVLISTILWIINILATIILAQSANTSYKNRGGNLNNDVQSEARKELVNAAVNHSIPDDKVTSISSDMV